MLIWDTCSQFISERVYYEGVNLSLLPLFPPLSSFSFTQPASFYSFTHSCSHTHTHTQHYLFLFSLGHCFSLGHSNCATPPHSCTLCKSGKHIQEHHIIDISILAETFPSFRAVEKRPGGKHSPQTRSLPTHLPRIRLRHTAISLPENITCRTQLAPL